MFILDPRSSVPIYQQLIDQVKRLVASGQLVPGAELPSVRELAQRHTVHPMTISKAYSQLEADGVLERRRGRPMTVATPRRSELGVAARLRQLDPQIEALKLAVRQLELGADEVTEYVKNKLEKKP